MLGAIIRCYIYTTYGSAVAEQFEVTYFDGEEFKDQNFNALRCIHRAVNGILEGDVLNWRAMSELEDYAGRLGSYIAQNRQSVE